MEAVRAIADPVRQEILEMLRDGPRTAGTIAAAFAVSRPAVSRHPPGTGEHGLVHDDLQGRERVYRLDTGPLVPIEAWLVTLRTPSRPGWGARLERWAPRSAAPAVIAGGPRSRGPRPPSEETA